MKTYRNINFLITISVLLGLVSKAEANAPEALKTEMLDNPVGLHSDPPRFSWILEDTARGAKQMAYRIQVASMPDWFDQPDLWGHKRYCDIAGYQNQRHSS